MPLIGYLIDNFNYYDKPEGEDPVGKILGLGKYGFLSAAFIGVYDAICHSECKNAYQFYNTFGYYVVPVTGMCVAFASVTYAATVFRKKDDKWNYVLGALSSISVLHAWRQCYYWTLFGGSIMIMAALLKKDAVQNEHKYKNKNLMFPEKTFTKTYAPWRNVFYRDYSKKSKYESDKASYYTNFY